MSFHCRNAQLSYIYGKLACTIKHTIIIGRIQERNLLLPSLIERIGRISLAIFIVYDTLPLMFTLTNFVVMAGVELLTISSFEPREKVNIYFIPIGMQLRYSS